MTRPAVPDADSWAEMVVTTNAQDLLRYFRRRVDQPEDAADLLGRTLLAIWENTRRVPATDEGARMWCFGIARNMLREHYRNATKRTSLAKALHDHLVDTADRDDIADPAGDAHFQARSVQRAVGRLDERSRELLILVHWDGFSIAQAARILSMNASTARTRYGRALLRLRRDLELSLNDDLHRTYASGKPGRPVRSEPANTPEQISH
jgi:RNA polymerase sigma-70 factor (ECF subfamily)